ncbi:MAG: hypothetical protein WBD86_00610 [Microgenomates group bacterium]
MKIERNTMSEEGKMRAERVPIPEDKKEKISRREFLRLAGKAGGIGLITYGLGRLGIELWKSKKEESVSAEFVEGSTAGFNQLEVQNLPDTANQAGVLATPTPFRSVPPTSEILSQQELKPTPTPEVRKMVEGFILADTIDLADHEKPIVMAVKLNSGKWIITPEAFPYPFSEENNKIFEDLSKNIIETYPENQGPTTWAHAGVHKNKLLFAADLERLLRNPSNITVSLKDEEGKTYQKKLTGETATSEISKAVLEQELIGATVYLFQGRNENSFPPGFFVGTDLANKFDGNILELKIAAGVRIPRWEKDEKGNLVDLVEIYSSEHVMDTQAWAAQKFPDSGFSKEIHWRIKFCSGRYSFEPAPPKKKSPTYTNLLTYARIFLGFVIPENGLKITKSQTRKFV